MKVNNEKFDKGDISWLMLLTVAAVLVVSLFLLRYNVVYTEGEVMQGAFTFLVCATGGLVLLGFYRRRIALWCVTLLGGPLLIWQANQSRNWAMLHEEVNAIIQYAKEAKEKSGSYPHNLEGYSFKHKWVKSHIERFETDETGDLRFNYFLNDPGISYWYSSKNGFGYYPD